MILITMAGLSSRFYNSGYTIPKYALELNGRSVFEWAVRSFENYFGSEKFLFVVRPDYRKPDFLPHCDGYLEVFHGEGTHWSFVEPGENASVIRTTEKERISDLCSDGLYYFKSQKQFCGIFEEAVAADEQAKGEFYIAPLYNRLIDMGGVVKYDVIGPAQIDFCGTPDEYEALLKKKAKV